MELEKIGTRSVLGTYILERDFSYIEQEKPGEVNVVCTDGTGDTVPISRLKEFIESVGNIDIRNELMELASMINQCLLIDQLVS